MNGASHDRLAAAILVLATVAALWRVCGNEFTNWDDDLNVTANASVYPPTLAGLARIWAGPQLGLYAPLSYTAWWVLAKLGSVDTPDASGVLLNPYLFHAANLLLHLLAAWAVYRILRLLIRGAWVAALAGALLFALHPLQVEPVAWVTGLRDVLCGALSLAAIWQYLAFAMAEPGRGDRNRWLHYGLGIGLLTGALLAKPAAVTVPLVAAALDLLLIRRRPWRAVIGSLIPWLLVAAAFAALARWAQPAHGIDGGPLWARPLIACDSMAFYLGKLAFPVRLAPIYGHAPRQVLAGRWAWFAPLVCLALASIAVWSRRKGRPTIAAAGAVIVLATLPVLGLIAFDFEAFSTVADRYFYVAMLGPALALAAILAGLERYRVIGGAAAAVWLLALGLLSFRQTAYWHDGGSVFRRTLAIDPSSQLAYCDLAADALNAGRPAEAERLARQAVRFGPNVFKNHMALGLALRAQGKHADAAEAFAGACRVDPASAPAFTYLSGELHELGERDRAIAACREAVRVDPQYAPAWEWLAGLLIEKGDFPAALESAEAATRADPARADAYVVLGKALARNGRPAEARQALQTALRLDPGLAEARDELRRLETSPAR